MPSPLTLSLSATFFCFSLSTAMEAELLPAEGRLPRDTRNPTHAGPSASRSLLSASDAGLVLCAGGQGAGLALGA